MPGAAPCGVTYDRWWRRWSRAAMLSRAQELRLLQMEQWLRGQPGDEGLARLARIEKALRSSDVPADWNFCRSSRCGDCTSNCARHSAERRPLIPAVSLSTFGRRPTRGCRQKSRLSAYGRQEGFI